MLQYDAARRTCPHLHRPGRRLGFGAALVFGLAAAIGGCSDRPPSADGRLRIAVSIIPQVWLVEQLAPEAEVTPLVAPGESPHTYQPTDAQVSRLMEAAVYFQIGAPFERGPWFNAIRSSGRVRLVDVREGLTLRAMEEEDGHHADHDHADHRGHEHHEHGHGNCCSVDGRDPHVWLSVRLLKTQAANIARTLADLDSQRAADYRRRLAELEGRLDALDAELSQTLAPLKDKPFVVFHPAWGYFAADYGLKQVAIEVDGKEPSDQELTRLQRATREAGVRTILVQPQISGKGAEAVAKATGGRVEVADPLAADPPATFRRLAAILAASHQPR